MAPPMLLWIYLVGVLLVVILFSSLRRYNEKFAIDPVDFACAAVGWPFVVGAVVVQSFVWLLGTPGALLRWFVKRGNRNE